MQVTAEATAEQGAEPAQYVINLCASTTRMALAQPKSAALKRFTFFVSRRREDGRERFRLHMGYFASTEEADEWLGVVRELYPAAWVGEAPGRKLRAAARAATPPAAEPVRPPVPPIAAAQAPKPEPAAAREVAPAPPAATSAAPPEMAALSNVREVLALLEDDPPGASDVRKAPAAAADDATDATRSMPVQTLYVPPPPVLPEHIPTVQALTPAPMAARPESRPTPKPSVPKAAAPKPAAPKPAAQRPAPPKVAAPAPQAPLARPAVPTQKIAPPRVTPPPQPAAASSSLSDTQVLRVLEERRADAGAAPGPQTAEERAAQAAIELLRPDDTRTMRALKDEVQLNVAVQFAVQLDWSVTPIDLDSVPPLAIFSAYTLYTIESNRDGRKWFGLRLGFFSDALSAKQVAYYVRSDFASVAVVPVPGAEKERAIENAHSQPLVPHKRSTRKPVDEFKLFDAEPVEKPPAPSAQAVRAKLEAAARADRNPARARPRPAARKKANSLEDALEQTLEILGASELEIDNGRGELLNDTGVRHLSVKIDKRTSTFSKLLDRLSDRVGKG